MSAFRLIFGLQIIAMPSYATLISVDKTARIPVFIQIATAISDHIRRGVIVPGARMPGTRALADLLQVHRKTVIAAYEELTAQGWLEVRASSGTFVSATLPVVKPVRLDAGLGAQKNGPGKAGFAFHTDPVLAFPVLKGTTALAFNDGFPDVRLAPWDAFNRAYRTVVRQGFRKKLLFYSDIMGEYSLRAAMTDYLRESRGLPIGIDNVLITRGSTMGMYLAANSILKPDDIIIVGALSYGSANLIFQHTGATLCKVPVDDRGLQVDAIEDICRRQPVRMVYVTPHHHYPTTVTMPAERRVRLLQLAQQYGFCILEDDYDFDFHYDHNPILPLAGADSGGHVVYVGSLCKAISPALRVGYVVAPVEVIEGLTQLRRIIDRQGDNLLEAALALMFREGAMMRHLKKAQKTYHRRRDLFCDLLKTELGDVVEFARPTGGMAVWARFDPALSLPALAEKAVANGLWIPNGSTYAPGMNTTRLGFASVNEDEIRRGMEILKKTVGSLLKTRSTGS
jgi:GntR family transcriptional regulator/MocR family aminotransferase